MNKKCEIFAILLVIFLCIITPSFVYGKYAHTFRKTINLNISKPKYSVIFHSNNGSDNTRTQVFYYGTSQKLNQNQFTNGNMFFAGWNTESDGSGTRYDDKQTVINLSSTNNAVIDLYAQWALGKAEINGVFYNTLKEAVEAVPTDDTLTVVKLLSDTKELITVQEHQNIEFDLQNYTISSTKNSSIIENYGSIKISNGTLSSDATQGAINVYSGASVYMDGGSIIATGTKQAVYVNSGGSIEITGNAYLSNTSTNRAAVQGLSKSNIIISGGTIISNNYYGVECVSSLTVGVKDGTSNHTTPIIRGETYGIYNKSDSIKLYDGKIYGTTKAVYNDSTLIDSETGYLPKKTNESINGKTYKAMYLYKALTVLFNANGGTLANNTKSAEQGSQVGLLPVPTRSNYLFLGWFTSATDGEEIDEDRIIYEDNEEYFAHWIKRADIIVAEYNGVQYHSLKDAIDAVPADNEVHTVSVLRDTRESVNILAEQNIVLDIQNYTIGNDGNKTIFKIAGTLTINDGIIKSNADYAVIDNDPGGHLIITGGTITGFGSRQAVYNNKGIVEISGDAYLSSCASGKPSSSAMERATIQNLAESTLIVTGGTIVGLNNQAISNEGALTVGLKDTLINPNSPVIIGETYAIKTSSIFNFYDGVLKGKTDPISGEITDYEANGNFVNTTEIIDDSTYKVLHLN